MFHERPGFLIAVFWIGMDRYLHVPLLAQPHKRNIGGEAVEPCGKSCSTPKCANLAEYLRENLLSQVFGFAVILYDPHAERVDTPAAPSIELPEGCGIALLGELNRVFLCKVVDLQFLIRASRHHSTPLDVCFGDGP
jgi:hypothetical protein